jgi:hypothetical protein
LDTTFTVGKSSVGELDGIPDGKNVGDDDGKPDIEGGNVTSVGCKVGRLEEVN